jgi:hypothetical protein
MIRYRLVLCVALLFVGACGLRRSSDALRLQLLSQTPIGSVRTAVVHTTEEERHPVRQMGPVTRESERIVRNTKATSYLKIYLGYYRNPLRVDVVAYYLFDRRNRLIDVLVVKQTDSL